MGVRPPHTLRSAHSGATGEAVKKAISRAPGAATTGLRATIPPMSHHLPATIARASRRSRLLVAALVMGLLLAACGDATPSVAPTSSAAANGSVQPASPTTAASPTTPAASASGAPAVASPAPSGSPEASADAESSAAYELIERQVAAIRGLRPHQARAASPHRCRRVRKLLTADFDKSTPPEYVAATERLYKALGLIPADSDLRKLTPRSPERRRRRLLSQRRRRPLCAVEGGQAWRRTNGSPSLTNSTTPSRTSTSPSSATRRTSSTRATVSWPARRSTRAMPRCS